MIHKIISNLEKAGKIKKQAAGFIQVEGLLKHAILDLKEAQKIVGLADRATYLMAYMAMLKAGRALLLFNGYVPDDGTQHKTVVEVTSAILGAKYSDLIRQFEIMRRKRNEMTYEPIALLSGSEAQKALSDGILLVKEILKNVKDKNPQLELNFE